VGNGHNVTISTQARGKEKFGEGSRGVLEGGEKSGSNCGWSHCIFYAVKNLENLEREESRKESNKKRNKVQVR